MGLTFSIPQRKKTDRLLLNRLRVELDTDVLSDSFDVLADRYHQSRIKAESERFANRKVRYEAVLQCNPKKLLREALNSDSGLETVISSFTPDELERLRKALVIKDLQEAPSPATSDPSIRTPVKQAALA